MEYLLECKVRRLSQGTIDNYDHCNSHFHFCCLLSVIGI